MITQHRHNALLWVAAACLLLTSACSTSDTPVSGPPDDAYTGGTDGKISAPDTQGDTSGPPPAVNFYVETAAGKALEGNVTLIPLQPTDDKYTGPADGGFQLDVFVETENIPDGASVTVKVDGTSAGTGAIASNGAKVAKVTIPCANNNAQKAIKVEVSFGGQTVEKTKAVTLGCGDACEAKITAPTGCLTQDADGATDGFQATFEVTSSTAGCDTAWIEVTADINNGKSKSAEVKLQNGKANVIVKLSADAAGHVGKEAKLKAFVKDSSNADRPTGTSDELTVKVTTESPVIDVVTPAEGKLTLADDANSAKAGLQVQLKGSVTTLTVSDIDKITIDVDGVNVGKATPDDKGVFAQDLEFSATKTYAVTVGATNSCGLKSTKEVSYQVFVDQATLLLTEPKAKAILLAKDDGDAKTATIYETQFAVALQSAQAGSTIGIYCRPNTVGSQFGDNPIGTALVTAGAQGLAIPVQLDVAALSTSVVCVARDDGANLAESPPVAFQVGLPAPCLQLTQPAENAITNAATLPVTVTATNLDGATVNAKIALKGGATFLDTDIGSVNQNNLSSPVELSVGKPPVPFPDGEYVLTVSASDKFGNKAADSACSDVTRGFTVDRTPPVVAIASPATLTLDPLVAPDADNSQPGYQTAVVVTVSGEPVNDEIEVCVKVGNFEVPCKKTTPGATQVTFSNVTLQPDDNVISVTATDAIGNKTAKPTQKIVKLVSDAVKVQLIDPTGNTAVATSEITMKVKVTQDGKAVKKAAAEIRLNGVKHNDVTITEGGNGEYTAVIKGLKQGPNTLLFVALPGQVNEGVSPSINVTYKTSLPTVTITTPSDGALYSKTAANCVAGSADCVLKSLKVSTTDAGDGSKVDVSADCGGKDPLTTSGEVASNALELVNKLTLPNNSTCKITATVTDEAGQKATSKVVTVTVDRTAPVLEGLASPLKSQLFAADDLAPATKGMQVALIVRACDLPSSSVISCTVTDDDSKVVSTLKSLGHGDIDEKCGNVPFGTVTLPDGDNIKLDCTTADAAGNATSLSKTLLIISDNPEVRMTAPVYVQAKACAKQADCGVVGICISSKCTYPWSAASQKLVRAVVLGVADGTSARLCTDGPTGAGAASCSVAGYKVLATANVANQQVNFALTSIQDGSHTFTVEAAHPSKPGTFVTSTKASVAGEDNQLRRVYLDVVAPTVKTILAPQGVGVPAGCLNRKSQDKDDITAGGTFTFAATASEDASVSIVADGKVLGTGDGLKDKTVGIPITIAQEGSLKLVAVATDLVGNKSGSVQVTTGKNPEDHTFTINTVPPSQVKFLSPVKSPIIVGDSRDVRIEAKDADTDKQPVTIKDGTKTITPVQALANSVVMYAHDTYNVLSDGSHTLTATIVDTCLNETTIATNPTTIAVDTQAPTVTVTSPVANANFADGDDADKNVGGYQVKVSFGTSGAKSYKLELGTDCDDQFKSCKFYVAQTDTAVTKPGGNEPDRFITIPFGKTTNYSIKVTATDENGNSAQTEHAFTVKLSGCLVALTGMPGNGVANNQYCTTKGQDCAEVSFDLSAEYLGPCGAVDSIKLFKDSAEIAAAKPAASKASFKATFKDGEDIKLEARLFASNSQTGSSGPTKLTVDLKSPVVSFVATDLSGFKTAASNATVLWGSALDLDTAKNNFQFNARITISDTFIQGGKLTKLEAIVGGNSTDITGSVNLPVVFPDSKTQTIDFKQGTVTNDATTIVKATAEDTNGNVGTAQFTVTVDAVAPGKVTLSAFQAADLNPRRPYAKLNFNAVGDNGTTGTAKSYEVRYSRKDITSEADFENACDGASLAASAIGAPKAAGAADSVMVEGPDGRAYNDDCKFAPMVDNGASKFYFAIRAVDAAGNKGAMSNVISTDALRLKYAKITGTNAPTSASKTMRYVGGVGDVNGDGKADFAIGGGGKTDFCVVYGQAGGDGTIPDIALSGSSGATHTCFGVSVNFGRQPMAPIDVNGDGVDDLVVDSATTDAAVNQVKVYLGKKGSPIATTAALTIDKIDGFAAVATLGHAGNFNGDKSTAGNPIHDFAFRVLPSASVTYDRVIIVPGSESWSTSTPKTIDLTSQADRKANKLATVHLVNPTAKSNFGVGIASVGNVLPDGDGTGTQYDDLAIGQGFTPTQLVILKGQALTDEVVFGLSPTIVAGKETEADKKTVRLTPSATGADQFAYPVKTSFDGDSIPDVAVLHLSSGNETAIYWLPGKDLPALMGKMTLLSGNPVKGGSATFKTTVGYRHMTGIFINRLEALGNFFDRTGGYIDLGGSRPSWAPGGRSTFAVHGAVVRPDSGIEKVGNYGAADLVFGDPFKAGSTNFGRAISTAAGDVNGDGFPDIIVGSSEGHAVLIY